MLEQLETNLLVKQSHLVCASRLLLFQAVCTPLLPHQKQALAWMTSRENSDDLPPFWKEENGHFFNILTNFAVRERPDQVLGGILADDMGLVRTWTSLFVLCEMHPLWEKVPPRLLLFSC